MVRGVDRPVTRGRRRRRGHARARPGARRGDRRHAGDRRLQPASTARSSQPGDTLASRIASAVPGRGVRTSSVASLVYLALILLVITLRRRTSAAQLIVNRFEFQRTGALMAAASRLSARGRRARPPAEAAVNRLRRGQLRSLAAVARGRRARDRRRLGLRQGAARARTGDLFTKRPAAFGETGGGIAPRSSASLVLVGIATAIALPIGVLIAIYVSEFAAAAIARVINSGSTS